MDDKHITRRLHLMCRTQFTEIAVHHFVILGESDFKFALHEMAQINQDA